jgi:hypothetical protein
MNLSQNSRKSNYEASDNQKGDVGLRVDEIDPERKSQYQSSL